MTDKNTARIDLGELEKLALEAKTWELNVVNGVSPATMLSLIALARRAEPSVAADERALQALLSRIDEAHENYERFGEVCSFEGHPMVYANTLLEIAELRAALASPAVGQQAAPVAVKDALRRCGADTDYHGKMLFTVPQFDHFVSMIAHAVSQKDGAAEKVSYPECSGTGGVMMAGDCADCNGKGYDWEPIESAATVDAPADTTTASASVEEFTDWLAREMPAGTVINDPAWWAPRILRAALARAPLPAQGALPLTMTKAMRNAAMGAWAITPGFDLDAIYAALVAAAPAQAGDARDAERWRFWRTSATAAMLCNKSPEEMDTLVDQARAAMSASQDQTREAK